MLPKERRVPRENFSYILSTGSRFNSPHLLLYVAKYPQDMARNKSRIAFSVSKKVCSKASDRNRYRRIGYSAVSLALSRIKDGYFLFFSYKKGSVPIDFKKIQNEVVGLLSSSSVIE